MADPKRLDHLEEYKLEEYKALRTEIMLYQQEMHRTWLWAIIPAGAVYTWLSLHSEKVGPAFWPVWFIPPFLVLLCFMRYLNFWCRIERFGVYQCDIEEDVFGDITEKTEKTRKRYGLARWNLKYTCSDSLPGRATPKRSVNVTFAVWAVMLLCSIGLSCKLSHGDSTQQGATQSATISSNAPPYQSTNQQPAGPTSTSTNSAPSQSTNKP